MLRQSIDRRTATKARRHPCRPRLVQLEDKCAPAVFTVTSTDDGGPGSLRQAMLDAEGAANSGAPDEIHFDIPGPGVHTIHPGGTLPDVVDPVIIDGYTQPGARVNTLAVGDDAALTIEVNGSGMSLGAPNLFMWGLRTGVWRTSTPAARSGPSNGGA
jgi:hypothetical protein